MKRLYQIGFFVGILIASVPLIMMGLGRYAQWQLHQDWARARHAAAVRRAAARRGLPGAAQNRVLHGRQTALRQVGHPAVLRSHPGASHNRALRTDAERPDVFKTDFVRITIPKIEMDAIVMPDVTPLDLAKGPGHYPLTDPPGVDGNCAIAAHRNMWGWWFDHLDRLRPGDRVVLETTDSRYVYRVTGSKIVRPSNTAVLDAHGHRSELTLITCTHPATRRLVVSALLEKTGTSGQDDGRSGNDSEVGGYDAGVVSGS